MIGALMVASCGGNVHHAHDNARAALQRIYAIARFRASQVRVHGRNSSTTQSVIKYYKEVQWFDPLKVVFYNFQICLKKKGPTSDPDLELLKVADGSGINHSGFTTLP